MQSSHKIDIQERIQTALQQRSENGRLRQLSILDLPIDFRSNDYLGLSRSAWIRQQLNQHSQLPLGATGSRLLSGNTIIHEQVERYLSHFYRSETALLYNSGYDANVGLLSTVIRPGDLIFYDEAIHASMHQGIKLSGAQAMPFAHNDVEQLSSLLEKNQNDVIKWILCEGYYSMDGDQAPLKKIVELASRHDAQFIVDEAHSIGCFGKKGRGLCDFYGVQDNIFARVVTFGKALGAHGAAILCNENLKSYLVNFSKPLIYSTALTPAEVLHIQVAHQFLNKFDQAQKNLHSKIQYFIENLPKGMTLEGEGPIFSLIIPGEKNVREKARQLQAMGLAIQPIVSPTVPVGAERLRIILHSFNTFEEIDLLIKGITGSSC